MFVGAGVEDADRSRDSLWEVLWRDGVYCGVCEKKGENGCDVKDEIAMGPEGAWSGFAASRPLLVDIADGFEELKLMIAEIEGADMCWAGLRLIRFGSM